ncbi:DUF4328 domain-containing protein [Streptomyces yokosukanensis]|uniref:DUF4328 domain-containing protein n=1 Tax=Streptomyces yokosukanensis TaxID=67386 RepID=UPI001ABF0DF4|nr:DUF4328 domain-containing protein [Streptomyces yokosukanensis]
MGPGPAHADLDRLQGAGGPAGLTPGSWFCPVVNLWFSRRVVRGIWDAAGPSRAPYRWRPLAEIVHL